MQLLLSCTITTTKYIGTRSGFCPNQRRFHWARGLAMYMAGLLEVMPTIMLS
jgi:hypothetical protein